MPQQLTTNALSDAEKEHLKTIYSTRRRNFFNAYAILMLVALVISFKVDYRNRYTGELTEYEQDNFDHPLSRPGMITLNIAFLETLLILTGIRIYTKRIRPYKKDLENGVKEMVPYVIMSKKYFEHTAEYFFSFDDPNYMHYEVDALLFGQCNVGDTLYVSRAPHSRYVFDKDGRFSLI